MAVNKTSNRCSSPVRCLSARHEIAATFKGSGPGSINLGAYRKAQVSVSGAMLLDSEVLDSAI
jgi:hypothetical protein